MGNGEALMMQPMKVLQFICPTGLYGAEMWILALAQHLDPHSVQCRLAVTREPSGQNLELVSRFKTLGLETHQIPMCSRFDLSVVPKLTRLVKRHRIHILHTHGYKSDILGLVVAKMAGIRTIATPHGFENARDPKLQAYISLGCRALKHFDRVAPLSKELRDDMFRLGIGTEKVRLIRNGVDLAEVETERRSSKEPLFPLGEQKIVYVGQMAQRKNVGDLLKAFDLLYREHKSCRLVLIGEGPLRASLESQASAMECAPGVTFLGYRRDRLQLLKEMDVFTMSSSLEGIPRCMMEAMAMEIPVAAYNIPGVDQLVFHEKTGLLAEFGQVGALKNCWERLLCDKNLAVDLARNAREHIHTHFSASRMADEYTRLYDELIHLKK